MIVGITLYHNIKLFILSQNIGNTELFFPLEIMIYFCHVIPLGKNFLNFAFFVTYKLLFLSKKNPYVNSFYLVRE